MEHYHAMNNIQLLHDIGVMIPPTEDHWKFIDWIQVSLLPNLSEDFISRYTA